MAGPFLAVAEQRKNNVGGVTGKGFKPKQSGNPKGRPPKQPELKARCIQAVDEHVFDAWLREVVGGGEDWVECSKLLAAYGYGKPVQPIAGSDGEPISVTIAINGKVPT